MTSNFFKFLGFITLILGIGFIVLFLYFPKDKSQMIIEDNKIPDTVYLENKFIPQEDYITKQNPKVVYIYPKPDTVYIRDIKLVHDTVYIKTLEKDLVYNSRFLTNYSSSPKLLNTSIEKGKLEFSLFYPNGNLSTIIYQTKENYKYSFNGFGLSKELYPWYKNISYSMRVSYYFIPRLIDFDIELKYKTTNFYYAGGISFNPNYPKLVTPYLSLGYEF